jgi:pimeloyl-ACP methyl ester carboxylesterase
MGDGNLAEFAAVAEGPEALNPFIAREREEFLKASADELVEVMKTLLGPEDLSVLTGEYARDSVASLHAGLADGYYGWFDDDLAHCTPWGFELAEIHRPVLLVHGDDDRFVPVTHGRWLAEHVPGVESRIDPNDGHLTLFARRLGEVHEWLLAQL